MVPQRFACCAQANSSNWRHTEEDEHYDVRGLLREASMEMRRKKVIHVNHRINELENKVLRKHCLL
jgi:hypothetical protein